MIFGLLGVTVVLLVLITAVLLWAVHSGQFEDMEGPAWRVLMDDDRPRTPGEGADEADEPGNDGTARHRRD